MTDAEQIVANLLSDFQDDPRDTLVIVDDAAEMVAEGLRVCPEYDTDGIDWVSPAAGQRVGVMSMPILGGGFVSRKATFRVANLRDHAEGVFDVVAILAKASQSDIIRLRGRLRATGNLIT